MLDRAYMSLMDRWLLEYDSATFASYINTLHRQFFLAQKISHGPAKHLHDWFNAKAAAMLVEASQARVSRRKLTMDNSPEPRTSHEDPADPAGGGVDVDRESMQFQDDEEALRDVHLNEDDEEDEALMEVLSTQRLVPPSPSDREADGEHMDEDDDELKEVDVAAPPPVFEPLPFDYEDYLTKGVQKRIKKGHEAVLEEQPKWSLLAKVLKEIEDTIARVSESHAGEWMSRPLAPDS
jgi:DNA excision repair protein ERCC-4